MSAKKQKTPINNCYQYFCFFAGIRDKLIIVGSQEH